MKGYLKAFPQLLLIGECDGLSFVIRPISLVLLVPWYKLVEVVLVFLPFLWEENKRVLLLNAVIDHNTAAR